MAIVLSFDKFSKTFVHFIEPLKGLFGHERDIFIDICKAEIGIADSMIRSLPWTENVKIQLLSVQLDFVVVLIHLGEVSFFCSWNLDCNMVVIPNLQ
jgi:hypothetical protein